MSALIARLSLAAGAAVVLLATPGCISLLPTTEPDTLYRLSIVDLNDADPAAGGEAVIIGRIAAPRGLAGDQIAIERDGRIAYMAGAAWLSPAPTLLYSAVIDAFHAEAPAIAPARAEDGVAGRYSLDLELRHFEALYDNGEGAAPLVRVGLRARLIDRRTRAVVGVRSLDSSRRAAANRQGAIVTAFSDASGEVSIGLADWVEGVVCQSEDAPQACPR